MRNHIWLFMVALGLPGPTPERAGEIVVSAAVSLSESIGEIARAFQKATLTRVTLNLGPSSTLARQIREGARVDVFISADEDQMDAVEREGRVARGSRVPLLSNQLVVVAASARKVVLRSPRDLLQPEFRRIATGDPSAVPVGVYAKRYLESQGLWSQLVKKIVPTDGVRAALSAVEHGHADLAIVYRTDAAIARHASIVFAVPRDQGPRIVYPAARLTTGRDARGAAAFLDFLQATEARAIFERAGFLVLPDSGRPVEPVKRLSRLRATAVGLQQDCTGIRVRVVRSPEPGARSRGITGSEGLSCD